MTTDALAPPLTKPRELDLAQFLPGLVAPGPVSKAGGHTYLSAVGQALLRAVQAEFADQAAKVRLGLIVSSSYQSELTVFVDAGPRAGSAAMLLWRPAKPRHLTVRVAHSTKVQRIAVWTGLIGGLVLGFPLAHLLLPTKIDPQLALIVSLLLGLAIAVPTTFAILKGGLGSDRYACETLTARTRRAVLGVIDRNPRA